MLGNVDENKILKSIADVLEVDEYEFISLAGEELPELSSVCDEIFKKISNSSIDVSLLKEETLGTDQQTSLCSENSFMYNKCSVGDTHAVPSPSRLPFNESKNRLCQEEFHKKPYHLLPKNVKRGTREICRKVFKESQNFKRHTEIKQRLEGAHVNTILQDIDEELHLDENEFIILDSEQLPELSTICIEIFNKISDHYNDYDLSKEVIDQHNSSRPVTFSENSETYDKRSVSDVHAAPGPSRLPFNESKGSVCKEEFQPKPYQGEPINVKLLTCKFCQNVYKDKYILRTHMQTHEGEKKTQIEQLPELGSVCTEIFNRISDPCTVSGVSKEVTFGTGPQIGQGTSSLALPELSSVCNEIFNRNPDPYNDSNLSKQVTSGANQEIGSNPVSFSEKSKKLQ
ncbi:hypothetical protein HNY73_009637 [Argiope bruennichi]|uniref:C2H2-type domain-containing protein n=1 Tax=Argiope bruennichi TaxID=94029 RepID=A0A8T0FCQ2_ARGBR|nr:hypothetical protein HNY73_009637 [Argiope bruennichi]